MCESMRASRHNSVDAHLGYTEADEEAHGKRYRAMGAKTNSYVDKKVCVSFAHHCHRFQFSHACIISFLSVKLQKVRRATRQRPQL